MTGALNSAIFPTCARAPCPLILPPAALAGSGLRAAVRGGVGFQEALQVFEGGVIGISGAQTDLIYSQEFAPAVSEHSAWVGERLGDFFGIDADGLKMQLPARHGGVLHPSGGGSPGI